MYESVIDLVSGEATMLFVPLTYTLATEEAERIGVDHVARMCTNDQAESSLGTDFSNLIKRSTLVKFIVNWTILLFSSKIWISFFFDLTEMLFSFCLFGTPIL